jgi:hypothetical protein
MKVAARALQEISAHGDEGAGDSAWFDRVRERALARASAPPPRRPRALIVGAIVLAVLLHVLFLLWLRDLMQSHPVADTDRIEVRLIDAPATEPALPIPPPLPEAIVVPAPQPIQAAPRISRVSANQAPANPAASVQTQAAEPLHLYNSDGSLIMPKDMVERIDAMQPKPNFVSLSTAPSPIMLPHRPLKIRPNHFAAAWVHPENETLLTEVAGKITDFVDNNLTAKKEFTTPWGSKIKCQATYLFVMAGAGCGWGFPPPPGGRPEQKWVPANVLDEH